MPPSKQAIERVNAAKERMRQAQQKLFAFSEDPDITYSPEELAENGRLVSALQQSINDFLDVFNEAVAEDLASR